MWKHEGLYLKIIPGTNLYDSIQSFTLQEEIYVCTCECMSIFEIFSKFSHVSTLVIQFN